MITDDPPRTASSCSAIPCLSGRCLSPPGEAAAPTVAVFSAQRRNRRVGSGGRWRHWAGRGEQRPCHSSTPCGNNPNDE